MACSIMKMLAMDTGPMNGSAMNDNGSERKLTFVLDESELMEREAVSDAPSVIVLLTAFFLRKRFIAKVTLAALIIGTVVAVVLPNRYTATTKILPPDQAQST